MTKVFLILLFLVPSSSFAVTVGEYTAKGSVFLVPIDDADLKKRIRPKNNINGVLSVVSELKVEIKRAAKAFGIDPVHVAAAIAGEHAMNVNYRDTVQQYIVQRDTFLDNWVARHDQMEDSLFLMIQEPDFQKCNSKSDYYYWYCIASAWYKNPKYKSGKWAWGKHAMYRAFTEKFFNPNGIGSTFGVGQMSPLRALMVSNLVASRTNIPRLTFREDGDIKSPFYDVLDPKRVVYYIAATVYLGIEIYKQGAHFDISENPGLTATLYNLGAENIKANQRFNATKKVLRSTGQIEYPSTNDLGKWVNQNIEAIEGAIR